MHRHLRLELADPLPSRRQLGPLRRAQPSLHAPVDAILATPAVDRLIADPQIVRDLRDRLAGLGQIEHPATELDGVTLPSHAVLLEDNNPTNPTIRVRDTRGRPCVAALRGVGERDRRFTSEP